MKTNILKTVILSFFAIMAIWSILTLSISPIVWYDEVFFASMTHSFAEGNGLALELDNGSPFYIYGPVYFLFTYISTQIGGFSIFSFRIVNLLFSFGCVGVLWMIMKIKKNSSIAKYVVAALFMTDVLFISNGHSGRMEFVALFFVLLAYYYWVKNLNLGYIGIAVSLSLAVMTTPRCVMIAFPLALYYFCKLVKDRNWLKTGVYVSIPILLYLIWIYASYGSIDTFIAYFTKSNDVSQNASLTERFIGGNFYVPKWNYPLLILFLLSMVIAVWRKQLSKISLYILPIALFYILVYDTGLYSVYILPFFLLAIISVYTALSEKDRWIKKTFHVAISICLLINLSIFSYKSVALLATAKSRDYSLVESWLNKRIPENSRVVGSCEYYYACIRHSCSFKKLFRDYTDDEYVFTDLIENYRPQYLFISTSETKSGSIKNADRFEKKLIGKYRTPIDCDYPEWLKKLIGNTTQSSYDGNLYEIVYNE